MNGSVISWGGKSMKGAAIAPFIDFYCGFSTPTQK